MLELHGSLAPEKTSFPAQPIFQLTDLLQLQNQLLELSLGIEVFKTVGGKCFDGFADFARQVVQKLLFGLRVLTGLVKLFEGPMLLIDDRFQLLLHLVHG